jgi:2-iminoacetate synthase
VQPFDIDTYVRFAAEGMNAVMVYQETYDKEVYPHHHLHGPKVDMTYRLGTPDRLGQAGIKKVGIGALYGLSNWRAEAWFVGLHLRYLETTYWQMRTSISFPRLRPHEGTEGHGLAAFGERDLVQAICAFRLLSPEVELSLSTRESAHFRNHAFRLGITSMSAGSRTNPGGYASAPNHLSSSRSTIRAAQQQLLASCARKGTSPCGKTGTEPTMASGANGAAEDSHIRQRASKAELFLRIQ